MELSHDPLKTHASFDDPNLVSRAGLVPVMALAGRCGLADLAGEHVKIARRAGVNAHLKIPGLVAGMAAEQRFEALRELFGFLDELVSAEEAAPGDNLLGRQVMRQATATDDDHRALVSLADRKQPPFEGSSQLPPVARLRGGAGDLPKLRRVACHSRA